MEESGGGGAPLVLTSLLALIVAASSMYALREPLESSRPTAERFDDGSPTDQVRAHLWQDPIRVAKEAPQPKSHSATTAGSGASGVGIDPNKPLIVLSVAVAADSSVLSREQRLRNRYAVWAALDTLGFEAVDGQHLHVLKTGDHPSPRVQKDCWITAAHEQPLFAFELARRNRLNASPFPHTARNGGPLTEDEKLRSAEQVLVLWTEDRIFQQSDHPLACLKSVVGSLKGRPSQFLLRVVGPNSSDTLRNVDAFIQRAEEDKQAGRVSTVSEPQFFSPMATTDRIFFAPWEEAARKTWKESEHVTRTIDSDLLLARVLVDELRNHGIRLRTPSDPRGWKNTGNPREQYHRILLISEWDTFYGRSLPLSFAIGLLTEDPALCGDPDKAFEPGCLKTPEEILGEFKDRPEEWAELPEIQHVSYLRGLDGKVAEEQRDHEMPAQPRRFATDAEAEDHPERASGPAQLDYVRRLAQDLQDRFADKPIRAVGILGSDVYDKLLLIRALRDRFPDAVFFTTDLDARLWEPSEIRWTRNLIVGSSFGLRVVEERDGATAVANDAVAAQIVETVKKRQSQLPPFRDNYQTSVYYASLLALGVPQMQDRLGRQIQHPRLFELGQSGPRLLDRYSEGDNICDHRKGAFGRIGCAAHHVWLEFVQFSGDRQWFVRFGFSAFILVAFALATLRRSSLLYKERMSYLEGFAAWGGIVFTYGFVLTVSTEGVSYEPFTLFEGISVWPTETLRLVIFFLSLFLIGRTHRLLSNNSQRLSAEFGMDPQRQRWSLSSLFQDFRWILVGRSIKRTDLRLQNIDGLADDDHVTHRLMPRRPELPGAERPGMEMAPIWEDYANDGSRLRRAFRISAILIAYLAILRIFVFGSYEPIIPVRDPFGFAVDRMCIALSVGAMIILLLYMVDAVMLAERVINLITTHDHDWPTSTYEAWGLKPNADPKQKKVLSEWLAIRLIALRTEVIGGLAVGPFFVIALFLMSRASFFDRWHIPLPVWVGMGLNVTMAIFAVVILWRSAEQARATSTEIIAKAQIQAETAGDAALASYIQRLADDVAQMSQGAFAPVWRQPFIQAILAPLGGWAATALFETWLG